MPFKSNFINVYVLCNHLITIINFVYQRFYLAKYQGRKLILQPQLGTVDLNAVFDQWPDSDENNTHQKLTKRNYLLQVSTYQMCVLSLFNIFDKLTFKVIYNFSIRFYLI